MTTETATPNDDEIAECDNNGRVSARTGPECDHRNQLDHLDMMLHDIIRRMSVLDPLVPLIPRALALLDPGAAMRRTFKRGARDAVPFRPSAPVHVGEAPEDSGPVGT